MSATTALDGLGAVAGTGGRSTRTRVDGADPKVDDGRTGASRTPHIGLAARPRAATPIFVDGGRRARWVRRLGGVVGIALGVWLASVGVALVGLGSTAGPSVATDGAVVHQPAIDQGSSADGSRTDASSPLFAGPAEAPAPSGDGAAGRGAAGEDAGPATGDLPSLLAPEVGARSASSPGRTSSDGGGETTVARPGPDEGRDPGA